MRSHPSSTIMLSFVVCLIGLVNRATAQGGDPLPAPELFVAKAVDAATIEFRWTVELPVYEMVIQDGKPIALARRVNETRVQQGAPGDFEARRVDGSPLSSEELVKELAKPTAVLIVRSGGDLDPRMRAIFRPDCVVLKEKPSKTFIGAPSSAAPSVGPLQPTYANPNAPSTFVPPPSTVPPATTVLPPSGSAK